MRIFLWVFFVTSSLWAEGLYERSVINYEETKGDNCIIELQKKIDNGSVNLEYDRKYGYLKSLLDTLNVNQSSQTLVFSKTSFHRKLISPSNPRALYFNENTYIGWVNGAHLLEIAVVDKKLGAVFYTLEQEKLKKPSFKRNDSCLNCHASSRTGGEPGFFVRSVFPDKSGNPIASAGENRITHKDKVRDRWGGLVRNR